MLLKHGRGGLERELSRWRDRAVYLEGLLENYRRRLEKLEEERRRLLSELRKLYLEFSPDSVTDDPFEMMDYIRVAWRASRERLAELEKEAVALRAELERGKVGVSREYGAGLSQTEIFGRDFERLRRWAERKLEKLAGAEVKALVGVALGYYSIRLLSRRFHLKKVRRILEGLVGEGLLRYLKAVRSNVTFTLYFLSPAGEAAFASRAWREYGLEEPMPSFAAQRAYALSRTKNRELYDDRALVERLAERYRQLGYEVYTSYDGKDACRVVVEGDTMYLDLVAVRGGEKVGVECETLKNNYEQTVRNFRKLLEYNQGIAYVVVPSEYAKLCVVQRAAYAAWVLGRSLTLKVARVDEAPLSWTRVHILRE
ncbi:MAG: hypothetical protein DRJ67_09005 [Thermoprotei archaeon]|nr:MAG: hypothetical protein DRJ67_09005 [Thermoprotei archaeon]